MQMINHANPPKKIAHKFITPCHLPLNALPFDIELVYCQFEVTNYQQNLFEQTPLNRATALTLLFSVKESLYKVLYLSVGHYFNFTEAQFTHISLENYSFRIILLLNLNAQLKTGNAFNGYFFMMNIFFQLSRNNKVVNHAS